jgi:hypothetical protein
MRFKLFAVFLLLIASGSFASAPAVAQDWDAGSLILESSEEGAVTGKTTYIWVKGVRGTFAVRFDYDNLPILKGKSFSGVGYLNCTSKQSPSEFYWATYDLSVDQRVKVINDYSEVICNEYKKFYPDSPALK